MLAIDELEPGLAVTHKNTGLRYIVGDLGEGEVLLTPEASGSQDLLVPIDLFRAEFVATDRYSARRGARTGRRRPTGPAAPAGPRVPRGRCAARRATRTGAGRPGRTACPRRGTR